LIKITHPWRAGYSNTQLNRLDVIVWRT